MKKNLLLFASTLFLATFSSVARDVIQLENWKFINEEVVDGQKPSIDESRWSSVVVPHDWAIDKPFDMNIDLQTIQVIEDGDSKPFLRTGRTGALPAFGIGWYRCHIAQPSDSKDKVIRVEFDGAMSRAKVYLNGEYVGERPYGYSSFEFDLSSKWNYTGENTLAVRLENMPETSRWYPGAGIYRNVRLVVLEDVHVAHWGTSITTPVVTTAKASVNIKTEINSTSSEKLSVKTTIFDNGVKVLEKKQTQIITHKTTLDQTFELKNPKLWSPQSPHLYSAVTEIYSGTVLKDSYKTNFGVRTIRYDKDKGFFLNNQSFKIQGVCMHHDLGPLGAAVNFRALQRQMEILKEMGCNAIRTSHNPPTPELLDICDSLGMLVQVEAFDEWKSGKNRNGYGNFFDEWAEKDLTSMILRDRNHPCVIMWSIGNETREQAQADGWKVAKYLTDICHKVDPTRPVTAGFNQHEAALKNKLTDYVDLVGFNYKPHDYQKKHEQFPQYTIYGSETASTVSSRGDYKFPAKENKRAYYDDYKLSSYDLDVVPWGTTPDTEFWAQDDNEFIFGEFVWTGFDYLGEPSPYNEGTPARSSYFGIVDLAGFPKDRFYLYQSQWSSKPVLHLLPHWNWPDRLNQNVPVVCYTNYPSAELFVNGVSQGVKQKSKASRYERYRLTWNDVVYSPGEIKVVGYDVNGKAVESKSIFTADSPQNLTLTPDRATIQCGGTDLSFITVDIVDSKGRFCPRADNMFFVEVAGAGKLRALCNGSPTDQTSFSSNYMRAYNGKLMIIVQSTTAPGDITVKVFGGKVIRPASVVISSTRN